MRDSSNIEKITDLLSRGELDKAKTIFRGLSNSMSEFDLLECQGNIAFYDMRFQDAVNIFESLIEMDESRLLSRYQYLVGIELSKLGPATPAFERFQFALEIDPKFVDPYVALGKLLIRIGDIDGAKECFRRAIDIDPRIESEVIAL